MTNTIDIAQLYFDETGAYILINTKVSISDINIFINKKKIDYDLTIETESTPRKIKIPDTFNYFTGNLEVVYKENTTNILPPFSFDLNSADNINYMSKEFFSHKTRVSNKNAAFYQMLSAKNLLSKENPFYLSLISIIGFRVSESPEHRKLVGLELIKERLAIKPDEKLFSDPIWIRWWLSSGTTISVLAVYYNDLDSAKKILASLFEKRNDVYLSQMFYWNLSSAMLIYGFLLFTDGELEKAKKIFAYLFQLTKQGLSEIFDDRNDRILSQYPDCNALIEIGRHAHACHAVLSGKAFKPGQRATYPLDLKDYYIDFVAAVRRFPNEFNPKLIALIKAKDLMNKLKCELYSN